MSYVFYIVGQKVAIDKKVSEFGETFSLLCTFETSCNCSVGWEVWNPDSVTLSVIDYSFDPNAKYTSETRVDGHILNIRNLSKSDLNKSYTCKGKFTRSKKLYLVESVVFTSKYNVASRVYIQNINKG